MPSFLVTRKMDPALAERVSASVAGDVRTRRGKSKSRSFRAWGRLSFFVGFIALVTFAVLTYRQSRREVEHARTELLGHWEDQQSASGVDTGDWLRRVEDFVLQAAKGGDQKVRVEELTKAEKLDELLAEGMVYLRVPSRAARSRAKLQNAARESEVDALAICFVRPPEDRHETTLLRHLGKAQSSGAPSHVHHLPPVYEREEFLSSSFGRRVRTADRMSHLERLSRQFEESNPSAGLEALDARLLLYAIDEPIEKGKHSDFDGEGPHSIRLGLIDLEQSRVLWQERRKVSPEWISEKSRLSFSRPLDSCRLAFDLRRDME